MAFIVLNRPQGNLAQKMEGGKEMGELLKELYDLGADVVVVENLKEHPEYEPIKIVKNLLEFV